MAGLPLPKVPFGIGGEKPLPEKLKTQTGRRRKDMGVEERDAAKSLGLRKINGSHVVQGC